MAQCLFEVAGLSLQESAEAEGLLNRFVSFEFSFNLLALCKILAILNPVNTYFETIFSDIASTKRLLASTYQTLQKIRTDEMFNEILIEAKKLLTNTDMTSENIFCIISDLVDYLLHYRKITFVWMKAIQHFPQLIQFHILKTCSNEYILI